MMLEIHVCEHTIHPWRNTCICAHRTRNTYDTTSMRAASMSGWLAARTLLLFVLSQSCVHWFVCLHRCLCVCVCVCVCVLYRRSSSSAWHCLASSLALQQPFSGVVVSVNGKSSSSSSSSSSTCTHARAHKHTRAHTNTHLRAHANDTQTVHLYVS